MLSSGGEGRMVSEMTYYVLSGREPQYKRVLQSSCVVTVTFHITRSRHAHLLIMFLS